MLDPFILACILAAIAAVIAFIFYLFSGTDDERDFEKAFGDGARKILNQEREKHKSKVKISKKKEGRERRPEVKQDTDLDGESPLCSDSVPEPFEGDPSSASASLTDAAPTEPKIKRHSKKEKVPTVASSESEEISVELAPSSGDEPVSLVEPTSEENKENRVDLTSSYEGRRKRKLKAKKEEESGETKPLSPELAQGEMSEPHSAASSSEKEIKSKKKVAVVDINDLDSNKVLTRIASLEEIEPEYISYLATYFHDNNARVTALENMIAEYDKKDLEHKKKIEQFQQSRAISDRQIADHVRVISELTSKLQALTVSEASLKQQILQLNNVRVENDTLKSALAKSTADAAAAARAISNLEAVKANNVELSDRLAKVTRSLNEAVEQNAALKLEIAQCSEQAAALEQLKEEFATLETATQLLKAELEEKTRIVEETKVMAVYAESAKKAETERDEIAHQFAQSRGEWEKKEAALMNEYTSLKNLVDELNKEVAKFEQFKKEQDELEQKLLAKEAELAEKSARLAAAETEKQVLVVKGNGRSAELETENAELRKKLGELESELVEAKKSYSAVLAELDRAREQASNEEVMLLKKTQPVDASANTNCVDGDKSEVVSLREENNRLQQKNEELRRRNFKVLEDVAALEKQFIEQLSSKPSAALKAQQVDDTCRKQLLEERKLVASAIGGIVNSPLNDMNYDDYVHDLANSLKAALGEARTGRDEDKPNVSPAEVEAELENYRTALSSVSLLLSQIEKGVNEQESFYGEKVAQLERELDKANDVIASANRLRKELRECEFLKKQIVALRKCLEHPEEKEIATPKNSALKSDESDWEVVSR